MDFSICAQSLGSGKNIEVHGIITLENIFKVNKSYVANFFIFGHKIIYLTIVRRHSAGPRPSGCNITSYYENTPTTPNTIDTTQDTATLIEFALPKINAHWLMLFLIIVNNLSSSRI